MTTVLTPASVGRAGGARGGGLEPVYFPAVMPMQLSAFARGVSTAMVRRLIKELSMILLNLGTWSPLAWVSWPSASCLAPLLL